VRQGEIQFIVYTVNVMLIINKRLHLLGTLAAYTFSLTVSALSWSKCTEHLDFSKS